jgi:glycosyltransferase involved in cell wall biosynthesis
VHPAFFDSGGMASAEAMAFGLPCVGFDLKAYKSYYPNGMVKVKNGDINDFAKEVVKLINNPKIRKKIGKEAQNMTQLEWSWQNRAYKLNQKINTL